MTTDHHAAHWAAIAEAAQRINRSEHCGPEHAEAFCRAIDRLSDALMGEASPEPRDLLPPERACCGTFSGSEHRATCLAGKASDDTLGRAPMRAAVDALMRRCQAGVGGRNALDDAHSILAECYGALGRQQIELERLRARVLGLEAVHEAASGAILQAVAAGRERCAKLCETETKRDDGAGLSGSGVQRGVGRLVPERDIVCELQRALARLATGEAMTEGELWSWVRSVMCQGADIRCDYEQGVHKGYEAYSARLDAAAAERADQLLARLKTPNVGAKRRDAAGGTSA